MWKVWFHWCISSRVLKGGRILEGETRRETAAGQWLIVPSEQRVAVGEGSWHLLWAGVQGQWHSLSPCICLRQMHLFRFSLQSENMLPSVTFEPGTRKGNSKDFYFGEMERCRCYGNVARILPWRWSVFENKLGSKRSAGRAAFRSTHRGGFSLRGMESTTLGDNTGSKEFEFHSYF